MLLLFQDKIVILNRESNSESLKSRKSVQTIGGCTVTCGRVILVVVTVYLGTLLIYKLIAIKATIIKKCTFYSFHDSVERVGGRVSSFKSFSTK